MKILLGESVKARTIGNKTDWTLRHKRRELRPWLCELKNQIVQHKDFSMFAVQLSNKSIYCTENANRDCLSHVRLTRKRRWASVSSPVDEGIKKRYFEFIENIPITAPPNKLPLQLRIGIGFQATGSNMNSPKVVCG